MECPAKGWDTCFCASMGTGSADEYAFGVKFNGEEVLVETKDDAFNSYFAGNDEIDFLVTPVVENERVVRIPEINDKETQIAVKSLEMWKEFDKRCLMCGSCTVSCSTCTCFTTYDMNYSSDTNAGERRRINASCHVDGCDFQPYQYIHHHGKKHLFFFSLLHLYQNYSSYHKL